MTPAWLTDTVTSDLDRALHYTLLWGLEGLELRTLGHAGERVPHVNEEKLRRRLREHEVPIVAVVPGLFEGAAEERAVWMNEVLQLEETLAFCKRTGCEWVVVSAFEGAGGSPEQALRQAADKAMRHGVRLAVLNEPGMAVATGAALGALLEAVDHPAVRAAWDPVAAVQAGEDPEAGLEAVAGRIELVRCANTVWEDEAWAAAPLEEGVIDWSAHLRRLRQSGFDGPVSLTVMLEPAPKWGLREATALIRLIRAVERSG